MAARVGKYAINKIAGKRAAQYEPADPHYENYTDDRGKVRQRKRAMPADLTPQEQKILAKIRRRAHRLDKGFSLCGFRVGYTFIIGFIPGAGDVTNALLGYNLVTKQAKKIDVPDSLISKMQLNTLIAAGVGIVPILGDVMAAAYKPNSRNAHMVEDFLVERAKSRVGATGVANDGAAAEAQAQQVLDRAKGGHWSARTGDNPALAGTGGQITAAHQAQQSSSVKVAPPVPPRM